MSSSPLTPFYSSRAAGARPALFGCPGSGWRERPERWLDRAFEKRGGGVPPRHPSLRNKKKEGYGRVSGMRLLVKLVIGISTQITAYFVPVRSKVIPLMERGGA